MGNVMMITEFFLTSLAFSVGLMTFLANPQETGAGFIKVVMAICAVSVMLALAIHLTYDSVTSETSLALVAALCAFVATYFFQRDERLPLTRLFYIIFNTSLVIALFNFHHQAWIPFLFVLSSSLFLGSVTYAMIMGHWYLVTPRLSEKPLLYASYFCWLFLLVKVVWTFLTYQNLAAYFEPQSTLGAGYTFNWLMLSMRVGWGYLVVGIMSYFSYRLIAMRSIQSATGMLYAMTFFIFIGELMSNYMFLQYGMML